MAGIQEEEGTALGGHSGGQTLGLGSKELSEALGCGTIGVNLGQVMLPSHVSSTAASLPRPHLQLMPSTICSSGPLPSRKQS